MQTDFAGSKSDYEAWAATIRGTHRRRITVTVLDLDHNPLTSLSPKFIDGDISYDTTRDVFQVITLSLLDPDQVLQFEPDSPSTFPLQFSRMIQIGWSVRVPALGRWVTVVPFTGRVTDFDREGALVTVTAESKERLALGQAGQSYGFPKKTRKTDIVRRLLTAAGETRMAIPTLGASTSERVTIRSMDSFWPRAKKLAGSIDGGYDLFYDGRGRAQMRKPGSRPVWTFDARTLASDVTIDRDPSGVRNRWLILGAKPKGKKTRVHADLRLPAKHSLSAQSLGRTVAGDLKPHWLIEEVESADIKTNAEAHARARRMRDEALRTLTSYSFDSLPIPHLEYNDLVRVVTDQGTFLVRMKQWTVPLGIEGAPTMSVGSLTRKSMARGRRRGHRGGVITASPLYSKAA